MSELNTVILVECTECKSVFEVSEANNLKCKYCGSECEVSKDELIEN